MRRATMMALILLLTTPLPVVAGTTGSISGCVRDEYGKPIAGVRVWAESPQQVLRTTTDSAGGYVFLNVTPGKVRLSFEKIAYLPYTTDAVVSADSWALVSTQLKVRRFLVHHFDHRARHVRPGVTADLYSLSVVDVEVVPPPQSVPQQLRLIPGVTSSISGPQQALIH